MNSSSTVASAAFSRPSSRDLSFSKYDVSCRRTCVIIPFATPNSLSRPGSSGSSRASSVSDSASIRRTSRPGYALRMLKSANTPLRSNFQSPQGAAHAPAMAKTRARSKSRMRSACADRRAIESANRSTLPGDFCRYARATAAMSSSLPPTRFSTSAMICLWFVVIVKPSSSWFQQYVN